MEQLADYQAKRIEALEVENARLQNLLNESKTILKEILREIQYDKEKHIVNFFNNVIN